MITDLSPDHFRITDATYGQTLPLVRCEDCGFGFADPPYMADLVSYYERLTDDQYIDTQDTRTMQMQRIVEKARKFAPGAETALDVGAGVGALVNECRQAGLEAVGIEPSRAFAETAKQLYDVDLISDVLPSQQLTGRTFDIVFLVDVIEHVGDPVALLGYCRDLLSPSGVLVVVTPDAQSLATRLLRFGWWHFRVAHVGYFNRRAFGIAAQRAKLEILRTERAKWYFEGTYLAERLTRYPLLAPFAKLLLGSGLGRRLLRVTIPLNLFDSHLFFLRIAR